MEIGNDSITGALRSVGNVKVWHRAQVHGNLVTQGVADIEPSAQIFGSVSTGTAIALPGAPNLSDVTFPNTPGALFVSAGEMLVLAPGAHPSVTVNSQGTLVLGPGVYFFRELVVNSASSTVVATDATRVLVRDAMALRAPPSRASRGCVRVSAAPATLLSAAAATAFRMAVKPASIAAARAFRAGRRVSRVRCRSVTTGAAAIASRST